MVKFAEDSSSIVKKPCDITMAADDVVVVDNSNNIPTSTSGDSTTENGTNSRDENFVIRSEDIVVKLYSSESDLVEQRPDAAVAEAANLMSAAATAFIVVEGERS